MSLLPRCLALTGLLACSPSSPPASLPAGVRILKVPTTLVHPDPSKPLKVQGLDVPMVANRERPPGVVKAPDLPGLTWLTCTVRSHPIRLAVADDPSNLSATLLADLDGDGDLTRDQERFTVTMFRRGPLQVYSSNVVFRFPEVEAKPLVQRTVRGAFDAVVTVACHREGTVQIDAQDLLLLLVDQDLDGTYGGASDFWLLESPRTIFRPRLKGHGPSRTSMIEAGEPVWIGKGTVARLRGIDAKGVAALEVGPESEPIGEYLRRRHERVRKESATLLATDSRGFLGESKFDPNRPKITTPLPWMHAIDLEQPLLRARAAGKPLLVYLDGDGVAACRFTDVYLLEDQAVASKLDSFLLVRWNVEFEKDGWSQRLGPPEFPRWVAVAPDGRVARVIKGFQLPEHLLPELDQALDAVAGKPPR